MQDRNVKDYLGVTLQMLHYSMLYGYGQYRLKGLIQHCAEGKITRWRTNLSPFLAGPALLAAM